MGFDLMVFSADAAPDERQSFMEWYLGQTVWSEPHSYDDPAVTAPELQAWYMGMIDAFPALRGPHATEGVAPDAPIAAEYSVGESIIYAVFAKPQSERAYGTAFRLAGKHGCGLFDVTSYEGPVWLPDGEGGLSLGHSE